MIITISRALNDSNDPQRKAVLKVLSTPIWCTLQLLKKRGSSINNHRYVVRKTRCRTVTIAFHNWSGSMHTYMYMSDLYAL